jgi:hypothetical protein
MRLVVLDTGLAGTELFAGDFTIAAGDFALAFWAEAGVSFWKNSTATATSNPTATSKPNLTALGIAAVSLSLVKSSDYGKYSDRMLDCIAA